MSPLHRGTPRVRSNLVATIAIALALVGSVVAVALMLADRDSDRRVQAQRVSERQALTALRSETADVLSDQRALAGVLSALPGEIGNDWARYAHVVTDQPLALSTAWYELVTERERAGFERRTGLRLTQPAAQADADPGPAAARPVHFVLRHLQSKLSRHAAPGLDVAGDPLRSALLREARLTGRQVASPPIDSLNTNSGPTRRVVVVYQAVRTRDGALKGWIASNYEAKRLVATVQQQVPGVRLDVHDGSSLVADPEARGGQVRSLDVAGRRWTVTASVPRASASNTPWVVLIFGLALSALILVLLRQARTRERYALGLVAARDAERDVAEAELEHERAQLARAQTIGRVGSFVVDTTTDTPTWSRMLQLLLGSATPATREEVVTRFVHADDQEMFRAHVADADEEPGRLVSFQARMLRADGSVMHAEVGIISVQDDQGTIIRREGTVHDVTVAREAHDALQEAAALHDSLLRTAQHAYIAIDDEGCITAWNPSAEKTFGWSAEEAMGQELADLVIPEDFREAHRHGLKRHLATGEANVLGQRIELSAVRRNGEQFPVEMTISHILRHGESSYHAFVSDISDRKRFEDQLRYLADRDALTGLYNRHRFEMELERVVSETRRYGRRNALMVLDLDGFKYVNDRFGHPVGDELVTRIGGLLTGAVRDTDIVARIGGDEFAVILHEAEREDALKVADNILDAIRRRGVVMHDLRHARVTTSIGVTLFDGESQQTGDELVVEADIAMYDAKEAGRDRCVVYDRETNRRAQESKRASWLTTLQTALEEDRFVLHAQPIIGICGNGMDRYELLLRLIDEDGELIPPGAFLYNAERFDLMGQIDRWVLREAVRLLHEHTAAGHRLSLAVNLSGRTMNDERLSHDLAVMLAEHPIPEGHLVIEVTETAAIVNIDRARRLAAELRALGCLFALDDFGSGFASFYYLKHLDFDYLKIDGEFIAKLPDTPTDQLVVSAVVDIAKGLGTKTIAEFVGDERTHELLRELGVDYGQGFHLGRPGPLSERLPPLSLPAR